MPVQLVQSVARPFAGVTTTQTMGDFVNQNARGVVVVLDTTVIGTGSVTVTINGKDRASGKYYLLLAGAAVITHTTNRYTVYPGIPVAAHVTASDVLPELWQIVITANNVNPATYSVGACMLV